MGSCASRHTNHKPNNRILFLFLLSCCQQCCLVVYVVDNMDNKTTINLYIYRFIEAPQEQDAIIRLVKSVPRHTLIVDRHLSKSHEKSCVLQVYCNTVCVMVCVLQYVYSKYTATHTPSHTLDKRILQHNTHTNTHTRMQHTHHHTHSINAQQSLQWPIVTPNNAKQALQSLQCAIIL